MKAIYKNRNLMFFLLGMFISGIGNRLTILALTNKAMTLTGSEFSINLVFILESLPILFVGTAAGSFIDRCDKKMSAIAINVMFACTSLLFAFLVDIRLIYIVIVANGILLAFYTPARVSLMPLLVDGDELVEANGLRMSVNGAVGIVGYAAAGILVGMVGDKIAFILDSVSFIILSILFVLLKPKESSVKSRIKRTNNYREEFKKGWEFIKGSRYIKKMFMLNVLTSFIIYMQVPLTYIFVEKYLGGKELMAQRTGYLFAAIGVGSIVGGIILGRFKEKNKVLLLSIALIADSILLVGFSLNRIYPITVVLCGAWGIVGSFTGSLLETIIQQNTPEEFLGCVSGFNSSVIEPIYILSLLFGGLAARYIDVMYIFIFCATFEFIVGVYFTVDEKVRTRKKGIEQVKDIFIGER